MCDFVINFWQRAYKALHNSANGETEVDAEVIEVNGKEHEVRKRENYTVGNNFAAASFWVSIDNAF